MNASPDTDGALQNPTGEVAVQHSTLNIRRHQVWKSEPLRSDLNTGWRQHSPYKLNVLHQRTLKVCDFTPRDMLTATKTFVQAQG
jgi:hypothetical protein